MWKRAFSSVKWKAAAPWLGGYLGFAPNWVVSDRVDWWIRVRVPQLIVSDAVGVREFEVIGYNGVKAASRCSCLVENCTCGIVFMCFLSNMVHRSSMDWSCSFIDCLLGHNHKQVKSSEELQYVGLDWIACIRCSSVVTERLSNWIACVWCSSVVTERLSHFYWRR